MFLPNSRYANVGTYTARTSTGSMITVVRLPLRPRPSLRGFHPRTDDQRLDLIAARYLVDATAFWRLCDASDAVAPDALAVRTSIAIPAKER